MDQETKDIFGMDGGIQFTGFQHVNNPSIIKVIGVGGGGGNAVNHMFNEKWCKNKLGKAILATFDTKILAIGFFEMDAPNHSHLTHNSCLARF